MRKLFKVLSIFIIIHGLTAETVVAQTATVFDGNWNDPGNWTAGVPNGAETATIDNQLSLNVSLNLGAGANYIINQDVSDLPGGAAYSIDQSNSSNMDVSANLSIEGSYTLRNTSVLTIRDNDTLIVDGDFSTSQSISIIIETLGVLIVRGDMELKNSSALEIDGKVKVEGDYTSKNSATVSGSGNMEVDGNVDIGNSSNLFGNNTGCSPGPCEYGSGAGLPIELVSFEATSLGFNNVKLEWITATETNNQKFVIEYSLDGKLFMPLTEISGAGNSYSEITYSTISLLPELNAELVYLRLKQIDFDGKNTSFKPVVIRLDKAFSVQEKGQIDFEIFPNPVVGDRLNLKFKNISTGRHEIQVIKIDGKIIKELSFYTSPEDARDQMIVIQDIKLNKGIYIVRVSNEKALLKQQLIAY